MQLILSWSYTLAYTCWYADLDIDSIARPARFGHQNAAVRRHGQLDSLTQVMDQQHPMSNLSTTVSITSSTYSGTYFVSDSYCIVG